MDVLGDVVARERRSDIVALRDDANDRSYTYHDFCTTSYKAGNFLRYLGVDTGDRVEIAPDPVPEPLLTFFGAALLGAVTSFEPTGGDAGAVVVGHERETEFDLPAGSKLAVYGGPPAHVSTEHWEKQVWSENPAFPPTPVDAASPVVVSESGTYSHREVLAAADHVVDDYGLDADSDVVVRESLTDPRVVTAGVVAPLVAGGTVVFPGDETGGDLAVGGDDRSGEPSVCDPTTVSL